MKDTLKTHHSHEPKESVGAVFGSREEARQALRALHKAHFTKSWVGVTSLATDSDGDQTLTAESASGLSLAPKAMGLVDALVAHGIEGDVARVIESQIEPGEALLTVQTENKDRNEAIAILESFGGRTELSGARRSADTSATREANRSVDSVREDVAYDRDDALTELPDYDEQMFYVRSRR